MKRQVKQCYNAFLIKHHLSAHMARMLSWRGLSLLLSALMLVTVSSSMFGLFSRESKAEPVYYGGAPLDGSTGLDAAGSTKWYNDNLNAGTQENPYQLKNADDLVGLATLVNEGNNFDGKLIELAGKSVTNNSGESTNVIDLRHYNGGTKSESKTNLWKPIGMTAGKPFKGTLFSNHNTSVINLNYGYMGDSDSTTYSNDVYGLIGYNEGTVKDFSVSFTRYATEGNDTKVDLDLSAHAGSVKYLGAVTGINKGTISNVSVGVGGQTHDDKGFGFDKDAVMQGVMKVTATGNAIAAGGVTGYNEGAVQDCYFNGVISGNQNGQGGSWSSGTGIGGIAGANTGVLTGCMAIADITLDSIGPNIAVGGVVGKTYGTGSAVSSCVFSGKISSNTDPIYLSGYNHKAAFGGVAGSALGSSVSQCISAASLEVNHICISAGEDLTATSGMTGGLIGRAENAVVNQSFTMGSVTSATVAGGLIGFAIGATSLTDSYSNCAVDTYSVTKDNPDAVDKKDNLLGNYEGQKYYSAGGGLLGYAAGTGLSVSNSYFAGSTLSPEMGSLCGQFQNETAYTNTGKFANVYFDSQLSPNRGVGANSNVANGSDAAQRKNTADFINNILALPSNEFVVTADSYPALNWANNVNSANASYNAIVKALSAASTAQYIGNYDNTYGNAYRVHSGKFNYLTITPPTIANVATEAWSKTASYTGVQNPGEELGGIYTLPLTIKGDENTDKYTLKPIDVQRKLLLSVNQTDHTDDNIHSAKDFSRLLDIANRAGGGYVGGVFALANDITETITVKSGAFDNPNLVLDNLFCSTLDGKTHTVSRVDFENKFTSMLGSALSGAVQNINFGTVNIGQAGALATVGNDNAGFLFSRSQSTTFSEIIFDTVEVHIDAPFKTVCFGLLTGKSTMGDTFSALSTMGNITVTTATVTTGRTSTDGTGIRLGLLGGAVANTQIANNTINKLTLTTGANAVANNSYNTLGVGGFFGAITDTTSSITTCKIKDLNATIGGHKNVSGYNGFGGIAGELQTNIENCSVQGVIEGKLTTSITSESRAGGISAFGNNGKTATNCTFIGKITGFGYAGGIVAYSNYGFQVNHCISTGTITATVGSSSAAGGMIGDVSTGGNSITSSYFFGNVTAKNAGGLVGFVSSDFTINNSYAKAIVTGTTAGEYVGGLVGDNGSAKLTVTNAYFAGQLQGEGFGGGLAGRAGIDNVTNAYFDKSIAGARVATVASISAADTAAGAELDAKCAVLSNDITAQKLGADFQQGMAMPAETNYPQLASANSNHTYDDASTRKVFLMENGTERVGYLTSVPSFTLDSVGNNVFTFKKGAKWDEVMQNSGAVYTPKTAGYTKADITYDGETTVYDNLTMKYDVVFVPFEYGIGTKETPYIIYNTKVLDDFRTFVTNGLDTEQTYYKIGSVDVDTKKIIGDPITLALDQDELTKDWKSVVNFKGYLDGNNSVVANLVQTVPYIDKTGNHYYGFFASSSGNVSKLTLNHVDLKVGNVGASSLYAGGLVGKANGGTYQSISIIDDTKDTDDIRNTNKITNNSAAPSYIGGLIGYLEINASATANITNSVALVDIEDKGSSGDHYLGGLVGYLDGKNVTFALLNIVQSATYGSISASKTAVIGGFLGGQSNTFSPVVIQSSVSTMDLAVSTAASTAGGLIGGVTTNAGGNDVSKYTINDSYYGGKLAYPITNPSNIGGLIGCARAYYNSGKTISTTLLDKNTLIGENLFFPDKNAFTTFLNEVLTKPTLDKNAAVKIDENSVFNYNVNHVPAVSFSIRCGFTNQGSGKADNYNYNTVPLSDFSQLELARSSTQAMTDPALVATDADKWAKVNGYYPIPQWLNIVDLRPNNTQQDETYMSYMARFYSAGIFYTNADQFGDNTYSNVYLLTEPISGVGGEVFDVTGLGSSNPVAMTDNKKMIQSTGNGGTALSIPLKGTYLTTTYQFRKQLAFKPSIVACGVSDASYFVANPNGMWITKDSVKIEGTEDYTTQYPWTIYTADQLQGLTPILWGNGEADGNLIQVKAATPSDIYNSVQLPGSLTSETSGMGDKFVLGADLDCSAFFPFMPIGTKVTEAEFGFVEEKAFDSSFNGRGHLITGLSIGKFAGLSNNQIMINYKKLGLFNALDSASVSNLGLVNPDMTATQTQGFNYDGKMYSLGSIAGEMANSTIDNCFSALPLVADIGDGMSQAGGLVGQVTGSASSPSRITNSFFTGMLYGNGSGNVGGIVGNTTAAKNLTVENCYMAGYIHTGATNAAVIDGSKQAVVTNCFYDLNGAGSMAVTNGAIAVSFQADNNPLSGNGFGIKAGSYPLQTVFATANQDNATAATVKIEMGDAHAATNGTVLHGSYLPGRIDTYQGTDSIGTITVKGLSFEKSNTTGWLFLQAADERNQGRVFMADLKCWYDNPTDKGVYTINTAKELLEFAHIVNGDLEAHNNPNGGHAHEILSDFKDKTVSLGADIDLSTLGDKLWIAAGTGEKPFRGAFDGNGHVITNIKTATPIFGAAEGATIKNLGLTGQVESTTEKTVTPLVSEAKSTEIAGCFSNVEITGANRAAGLVGTLGATSSIRGCYNMGAISGDGTLAGLALVNEGTISDSYNVGVITSLQNAVASGTVSGIAAEGEGTVTNCYNAAYISSLASYVVSASNKVTNCAYDSRLLDKDSVKTNEASTSIDTVTTERATWSAGNSNVYPQLAVFSDDSASANMKTASGLSALRLQITGVSYQEFTQLDIYAWTNKQFARLDGNGYEVTQTGDRYVVTPGTSTGAKFVTASVGLFSHSYYTVAKATMRVRYKFDFTSLFQTEIQPNQNYHAGIFSSSNSWNATDPVKKISTVADYTAFVDYVNTGKAMAGTRFVLDYNINFSGAELPMMTGEFNGVFEGGYYTLSNFVISNSGSAAMFANIGPQGKVMNLALENVLVTVQLGSGDMKGSVLALKNQGLINNIAMQDCTLRVENQGAKGQTYIGLFAAENNNKITGCYSRQTKNEGNAIRHNSGAAFYNGTMVGLNTGTLSGCYVVGSMGNQHISLIAGTSTGQINNCYFATVADADPTNIAYAYLDKTDTGVAKDNYYLKHAQMKKTDFAVWLSSNIYAGAYEIGSENDFIGKGNADDEKLNGGFPHLAGFQLVKYNLSPYFSDSSTTMLLSVWNLATNAKESSISNGIFALDNLDFKYFSDIITKEKLQFNMGQVPNGINYKIIQTTVYGAQAVYQRSEDKDAHMIFGNMQGLVNTAFTVNAASWATVTNPNLIVVNIAFSQGDMDALWGNYRRWSSTK